MSWTESLNATKYYLFRAQGSGSFEYVSTVFGTSYSAAGLAPTTTYSFKVQATDDVDVSPESNIASATTGDTGGSATFEPPQNVTAVTTLANRIQVDWTAVSGAVKYYVFQSTNAGPYAYVTTVQTNSYTARSLAPNTEYAFVIQAVNAADVASANSAPARATTGLAAASVTAVAISASRIEVDWTSVSGAVKYYLFQSEAGGPLTYVSTVFGMSYSAAYLTEGTTYSYVVSAVNAQEQISSTSQPASATTSGTIVGSLPAPVDVAASALSTSRISVTWSSVPGAAKYYVFQAEGAGSPVYVSTTTGTSFRATGLNAGTSYSYYVQAVDSFDVASANSTAATASTLSDTPAIVAPTDVTATAVSQSRISVSWTPVSGAVKYYVFQATGTGPLAYVTTVSAPDATYSAHGLSAGTSYSYVIQAVDSADRASADSSPANAMTFPADIVE